MTMGIPERWTHDLTRSERLFIWRRRLGLNQEQAAATLFCKRWNYSMWESGREIPPAKMTVAIELPLEPHESCVLKRRHGKVQVGTLAWWCGVSKETIRKRERGEGDVDALVRFWFG